MTSIMNKYATTGYRVAQIRANEGITQAELSKKIGISRPALSAIENGITKISIPIAYTIEHLFGYNYLWILTGDGVMKPDNVRKQTENPTGAGQNVTSSDIDHLGETGGVNESKPSYSPLTSDSLFSADQKINIDEAMGKAYKVLNAGTALSVALYMNIQQFAAALDTGIALQSCQDQIKLMQEQIDALNKKVDRLSAAPVTTEGPGDGSVKKAM